MKVMRIDISNFRGIACQEIVPNGKHVRMKGPNGAGKTSAALAFLWGLSGRGTSQPVRNGEERAEVKIDVGDYVFTRTAFADGRGSRFAGRGKGAKELPATPAEFVKQLVGTGIALDPLAIFSMPDDKQAEKLLDALKVDVRQDDAAHERVYKNRTTVNRTKEDADARVRELEARGAKRDAPAPVDPKEAMDRVRAAEHAMYQENIRQRVVVEAQARVKRADEALERAVAEAEAAALALKELEAAGPVDTVAAGAKVEEARNAFASLNETNRAAELGAELREKLKASEDARSLSETLTKQLDDLANARAAKIAAAAKAAGLDGLGFSPDRKGVNVHGVRLAELNMTARVKLGIKIGLAENPELRTAIVDQAEAFDATSTRELIEWGEAQDVQLVLASVTQEGNGLEIEVFDGDGAA